MDQMPVPAGHLVIAVLSYNRLIDDRVCDAVYAALPGLARIGWRATIIREVGNADLCDARNTVLAQFHSIADATKLLFIDGDISYESGSIERIVSWDVNLVGATYLKRQDGAGWPLKTLPRVEKLVDPATRKERDDGLMQVAGIPGGFMCISRKCIEKMVQHHADEWYTQPRVTGKRAWNIFRFGIHDHERWGEDIYFCWVWRQIGGKVWLDPHLLIHHHGDKTYSGRAIDYLRETNWLQHTTQKRKILPFTLDASNDLSD